jgi:glycosyltransferase involved in cell wall biosynthesis
MRIAFNKRKPDSTLGPYVFQNRLIKYFESQKDIKIVRATTPHDVHFIMISGSGRRADQFKSVKILRVDGIYHDLSRDSIKENEGIYNTYHSVDGIIFQCKFAQDMLYKHFGKPKRAKHETIIYNGVDQSFTPKGDREDFGFKYTIIVSGKWYIHKRLSCMINSFLELDRQDVGMVVLGEVAVAEQINHPRIKYLGTLPSHELPKYYRGADVMLHYAFVDWCPNTTVEGISCGLPVITTHNGGTPELLQGCGFIIKSDPDYNMEFIDFQQLPKVNRSIAAAAINLVLKQKSNFIRERPDLQMGYCGQQYLTFFKKVLNG